MTKKVLRAGMTTKDLRNEMFTTIEGTITNHNNILKLERSSKRHYESVLKELIENNEGIELDEVTQSKKTYYEKEIKKATNNIYLLTVFMDNLEDTKKIVKTEEKTLFILGK